MKKVANNIRRGLSNIVRSLLSQIFVEGEMNIDNWKFKIEGFLGLDALKIYYFENLYILSNAMHATQDVLPNWEESLGKSKREIGVVKFKKESTPRIST